MPGILVMLETSETAFAVFVARLPVILTVAV